VAPPGVSTMDIYRGVMPFIIMQVAVVASILFFPGFFGLL
jgi:TRAP-type mannitol/chloroaromatic compound transport system permease large subunit